VLISVATGEREGHFATARCPVRTQKKLDEARCKVQVFNPMTAVGLTPFEIVRDRSVVVVGVLSVLGLIGSGAVAD